MKIIVNTKVIEKAISYKGDSYMVWEYTNENKNKEIAIMDKTGYDVSLKTKVLEKGKVKSEVHLLCPDPEEYIHEQFINFEKKYKTCNRCSYDILDDDGNVMEHYCVDDNLN